MRLTLGPDMNSDMNPKRVVTGYPTPPAPQQHLRSTSAVSVAGLRGPAPHTTDRICTVSSLTPRTIS